MKLYELISVIGTRPKILQEENLFELNFNDKRVIESILDAPISCGFEAETIWATVAEGGVGLGDIDSFYDRELDDYLSSRDRQQIESDYFDWILESDRYQEAYASIIDEEVSNALDDEDLQDEFLADQGYDDDTIEEYKEQVLADTREADRKRQKSMMPMYQGWDLDRWKQHYLTHEVADDYRGWVSDKIMEDDDGTIHERAFDEVRRNFDIDDWANYEFGNLEEMLSNYHIYVDSEDKGIGEVANMMKWWIQNHSQFGDLEFGEYHSTAGSGSTVQSHWRVEEDSSISGNGQGAEIISPVYYTPREMLREMRSLFEFLEANDAYTNRSTGLHVTMSMREAQDNELNKLKVALLLGDKYLLKLFDRLNNTYTTAQTERIRTAVRSVIGSDPDEVDDSTIEGLEKVLMRGVSREKFASSHFKSLKNTAGNNLVEFRIAGGNDYHKRMEDIERAVIRYAVVLQAGYNPEAYREDYIRAIVKAFNKALDIDNDDKSYVDRFDNPIVKSFMHTIKDLMPSTRDWLWELAQVLRYLLDENAAEVDRTEARKNFLKFMARLSLEAAGGHLRQPLTSQRIISIRRMFKFLGITPQDFATTTNYFDWLRDYGGQDKVIDGFKLLWGGKKLDIKSDAAPAVFNIDPSEEALYVTKDLIDNPTVSSRISMRNNFRKVPTGLHKEYVKSKEVEQNSPYYETAQDNIRTIERAYNLDDNFVHVPWNALYLNDLFKLWAKRGVQVNSKH